jgi:hypothetical protein
VRACAGVLNVLAYARACLYEQVLVFPAYIGTRVHLMHVHPACAVCAWAPANALLLVCVAPICVGVAAGVLHNLLQA